MTSHSTTSNNESARRRVFGGALVVLWAAALAFGWWLTMSYEFATAESGEIHYADDWPTDSGLARASDRAMLLIFLHPKCPCTRATLNELDRLVTLHDDDLSSRLTLQLVATVPADVDHAWWDTNLVAKGQKIAGCSVFVDRSGREAARFGVSTSGTLMLFDEAGKRRYAGGITVSRGHQGSSAGSDFLRDQLAFPDGDTAVMPVFGCRLCLPVDEKPGVTQSHTPTTATQASTILFRVGCHRPPDVGHDS